MSEGSLTAPAAEAELSRAAIAQVDVTDQLADVLALPEHLRVVVALRYYAGLDATEIGAALGIPAGTVRSRLHRALEQLRDRLAPPASRPDTSGANAQPWTEGRA